MTTSTSSTPQPDLVDVLQRRREYCRAMLELSRQQQELITGGQFSELIQLIARKQRVLEELTELGQAFGGIVNHWKAIRDQLAHWLPKEAAPEFKAKSERSRVRAK